MPEVVLCCDCKQPINKATDDYVVIKKATDNCPEVLAHVACEQKRATRGPRTIVDDILKDIWRWPRRP
jgi:hypothetical protein